MIHKTVLHLGAFKLHFEDFNDMKVVTKLKFNHAVPLKIVSGLCLPPIRRLCIGSFDPPPPPLYPVCCKIHTSNLSNKNMQSVFFLQSPAAFICHTFANLKMYAKYFFTQKYRFPTLVMGIKATCIVKFVYKLNSFC